MDISVVLPVMNECRERAPLLPQLKSIFAREKLSYEILVIDGNSTDGTREVAAVVRRARDAGAPARICGRADHRAG